MARIETSLGAIGLDQRGAGGVPIVFLHGVGSDRSAWAPQLDHFGRRRRAVALDFPGYGDSAPLTAGEGAPHDRFAATVVAALDALDIDRAHLCGLSFGAVVAIAVAHRAADRLASLVLADGFAVHPDGPGMLERSLAASSDMAAMAHGRVPLLLAPGAAPALAAGLTGVMARIDPAAFRLGAAAVWPADQRDRAAAIAAPTLVLCGAEDRVTPPALSDALAALIPGARWATIADAGHLPNLEQPAAFDAAVEDFLDSVECVQPTAAPYLPHSGGGA